MTNSYSFVCVLCLAALVTRLGVNAQGTLEVHRTNANIDTVLGCTEILICEGQGDSIKWKVGRRVITDKNTTIINGEMVHSNLSLTDVSRLDATRYTCEVRKGTTSYTMNVVVTVSDTIVVVDPIEDIDISTKHVGDTLSLECRARTCHKDVTVSIVRGSQLVAHEEFPTGGRMSVVGEVEISANTADGCVCQVRLPDGTVFLENFSITGTPRGVPSPIPETNNNRLPNEGRSSWPTTSVKGSSGSSVPCIKVIAVLVMLVATFLHL